MSSFDQFGGMRCPTCGRAPATGGMCISCHQKMRFMNDSKDRYKDQNYRTGGYRNITNNIWTQV